MNIYKGLLFLHGYLREVDPADDDFGPTYGNRVATEKAVRERWEPERTAKPLEPIAARTDASDLLGCR